MIQKCIVLTTLSILLLVGVTITAAQQEACEAALPETPTIDDHLGRAQACLELHVNGPYSLPDNSTTQQERINSYFFPINRFERDMRSAIRLDPLNPALYVMRAEGRSRMGDPRRAILDYTFAITLDPNNSDLYIIRAKLQMARRDYEGVIDGLQLARLRVSETAEMLLLYGLAAYRSGGVDEALMTFQDAVVLDPENGEAFLYIGDIQYERGNMEAALAAYQSHLEFGPERSAMANYRAIMIERELNED